MNDQRVMNLYNRCLGGASCKYHVHQTPHQKDRLVKGKGLSFSGLNELFYNSMLHDL